MQLLRAFFRDHRRLAILLVALALCMKTMVPTGFMVGAAGRSLSITICDGQGPDLTRQISLPSASPSHEKPADQGKAPDACPYSALAMAGLAGPPAALLAVALAFIMALAIRLAAFPQPAPWVFLRPPPRGPPAQG